MSNVSIALNILPAIKDLERLEKSLKKVMESAQKIGKVSKNTQGTDAFQKQLWGNYVKAVASIEHMVEAVAVEIFNSVVARTKKHTNRAAGSWAISWNTEDEISDIGFLHPDQASDITFYGGSRDWYPEAPVGPSGTKVLGIHDWAVIESRHADMVNKVIHEFTFSREWGRRDDKGRMMSQKTLFIYNSCPYIQELVDGSFSDNEINSGATIALTVAEVASMLRAGTISKKVGRYRTTLDLGIG